MIDEKKALWRGSAQTWAAMQLPLFISSCRRKNHFNTVGASLHARLNATTGVPEAAKA